MEDQVAQRRGFGLSTADTNAPIEHQDRVLVQLIRAVERMTCC